MIVRAIGHWKSLRVLEVALEEVHLDAGARLGAVAPQLGSLEADGVEVLRVLAPVMRIVVGEDHGGVLPDHHTDPAADVGGKPRMAGRLMVPGAHPLAGCEERRGSDGARVIASGRAPRCGFRRRRAPPATPPRAHAR